MFHGSLDGVIVAEIEIPKADTQFPLPPFVGEEVTGMSEYYNSNIHLLAKRLLLFLNILSGMDTN